MRNLVVVLVVMGSVLGGCTDGADEAGGESGLPSVITMENNRNSNGLRFSSVESEDVETSLNVLSASVGDVTGDGFPDLLIPSIPPKILVNQNGTSFAQVDLLSDEQALPFYTSSAIHDVTGDGLPDVLVAGIGTLQVIENGDDGWTLRETIALPGNSLPSSIVIAPDYDGDSFPDHLFVLGNEWPQVGSSLFNNRGALSTAKGPSTVFRPGPDGLAELSPGSLMTPEMVECLNGPSWTGTHIPRQALGLHDLLYIGNVKTFDCLLAYDQTEQRYTGALDGSHSAGPQGMLYATMGVDYWYDGSTVNLATSDFYQSAIHLTKIPMDGSACTRFEGTYENPDGSAMEVGWGVIADRDVVLVARGDLEFEDDLQTAYKTSIGSFTSPGGINLYEPDASEGHQLRFDQLENELEGLPFFHLAAGDFHGADGGDGCLDILATSTFPFLNEENIPAAIGEGRLLVGHCDQRYIGVSFEALPGHLGSMVEVEFDTGDLYRASSKGNAGVGGTRDPRVRIPLMGEENAVARIEVSFPDGTVRSWINPPLNRYLSLDEENWVVENELPPLAGFENPAVTECPPPY